MSRAEDRYPADVLAVGWQRAKTKNSREIKIAVGLVLEDPISGFCGAVVRWENGLVVLEDRDHRRRSFSLGPGLWFEGRPVSVRAPIRSRPLPARRLTASGSRAAPASRAKSALPSRIFVEGRHDAELVEKVWGDDLRHSGVVVEYLAGIDDLPAVVANFAPRPGRRLGVLVDHLVPGSKETKVAQHVSAGPGGRYLLIAGHPYVDIWQAVKPQHVGLTEWPAVPRSMEWKHGACDALGLPHHDQSDIAEAWRFILGRVSSWTDLEASLLTPVEQLIDFVTQDHVDRS